jgi:NAD(P)-dependent dehydrogenase (short-subunit alcohol dehydrogenase family)
MIRDAKKDLGPDFGPEGSPQIFKRFAEPGEIANMIAWLLSDESRFVTGSAQMMDAGWTA